MSSVFVSISIDVYPSPSPAKGMGMVPPPRGGSPRNAFGVLEDGTHGQPDPKVATARWPLEEFAQNIKITDR